MGQFRSVLVRFGGSLLLLQACLACASSDSFKGAFSGPPRWDLDERFSTAQEFDGDSAGLEILGNDLAHAPGAIWGDMRATVTDRRNWPLLGGAVLAGLALENSSLEPDLQRDSFDNESLSPAFSSALDAGGRGSTLLLAGVGLYGWGLATRNPRHYRAGKTALAAMTSTGLLTLATKVLVNDQRPNGGDYGYPSGHTSMSVALATSLHASYGWKVGVPAYLLSLLVAYQRVDSGAHDLDDIFVGAALGFVVSREVHSRRGLTFLGAEVAPFVDPVRGGAGISLTWTR